MDEDVDTPGVGTETPGVDENDEEDEDDDIHDESANNDNNERTYQSGGSGLRMNLRKQKRKEYNVFTQDGNDIPDDEEIMLLNMCDESENGYEECEFNKIDAEYMFLHTTLGWREGINDMAQNNMAKDTEAITKLAEYLFLTEQMNWKKGLKVLGEKGEGAIEKELKQIHDMQGFQPKHWFELTKDERANALKYLMYLKEK